MQWQGSNNGRGGFGSSGGSGRGGGRFSGGRNSSRGGGGRFGGGRFGGGRTADRTANEPAQYEICSFFAKGNSCRNGDNCRFSHTAAVAYTIPAHQKPIHSMGVMNFPEGPKLLSGSADGTVKLWNLATQQMETSVSTPNIVRHIEVEGDHVLWSVDEPAKEAPKFTVGTVYKLVTPQTLIPIKRSEDMPFTHASGEIRSFCITLMDGVIYVVTAAADGLIRTWKFDAVANIFEPVGVLEGHLRAITCLLLQDAFLWSGSMDCSLRVWEVGSGQCVGVLTTLNGGPGHADAVTCLVKIPPTPTKVETLIASGGADGAVNVWTTQGQHQHACGHASCVTSMTVFQDEYNGVQSLIIGLADGNLVLRSCVTMSILFTLSSMICQTKTVWSINCVGRSCFAVGGEDGNIVLWQIRSALLDKA